MKKSELEQHLSILEREYYKAKIIDTDNGDFLYFDGKNSIEIRHNNTAKTLKIGTKKELNSFICAQLDLFDAFRYSK